MIEKIVLVIFRATLIRLHIILKSQEIAKLILLETEIMQNDLRARRGPPQKENRVESKEKITKINN